MIRHKDLVYKSMWRDCMHLLARDSLLLWGCCGWSFEKQMFGKILGRNSWGKRFSRFFFPGKNTCRAYERSNVRPPSSSKVTCLQRSQDITTSERNQMRSTLVYG
eukprot:587907-Amphidinium_carterae.1